MATEKDNFSRLFEEALNKSIEANKIFIREGSRFFQQMSNRGSENRFSLPKGDTLTNAYTDMMRLNLDHFNRLMDLGIDFLKKMNDSNAAPDNNNTTTDNRDRVNEPSFVLENETEAGKKLSFQFILDNVKQQATSCELVHTEFSGTGITSTEKFNLVFNPSRFSLDPGESKSIDISIDIPPDTPPGLYSTKVQVKGFEPAHFLIQVTVIESQKQPITDGGKKEKSKRK